MTLLSPDDHDLSTGAAVSYVAVLMFIPQN